MTRSKYILHLLVFNIFIIKLQNIVSLELDKSCNQMYFFVHK